MRANTFLGTEDKEAETIQFIKEHEPEEGYFLGFSGGKDSIVLYDIAKKSGVKFTPYYSATGIDPPEVVKFIKENYPDVVYKRPELRGHKSFFGMIKEKGFPTKFTRWCCDELKKKPTLNVKLNHRLLGIRAEESLRRSKLSRICSYRRRKSHKLYYPLLHWLEWEIWSYIEKYDLPYCSLYDEGFNRIGCVVCPFLCNPQQGALIKHKLRWPKHYKAFEKAMYKLWIDRERDRQFKYGYSSSFEEFLDNWYKGNSNFRDKKYMWEE